jgi:hypothetical protein
MNAHTLISPVIPPHPLSPHDGWLKGFPLRSFLELGAYRTAPGSARGHVRNLLREWRLDHLEEPALAVVSELIANSVAATATVAWAAGRPPAPSVRLWLLGGAAEVMVAVWDAVPAAPVPRAAGPLEENGRGLTIVAALSARWDFYHPPAPPGGKVTRALITATPPAAPPDRSPTAMAPSLAREISSMKGGEMAGVMCSCGFTEGADEAMTDHLLAAFTPGESRGRDGKVHEEWRAALSCSCGVATTTPAQLDAHFLAMFTPDNAIGRDGKKHVPSSAGRHNYTPPELHHVTSGRPRLAMGRRRVGGAPRAEREHRPAPLSPGLVLAHMSRR